MPQAVAYAWIVTVVVTIAVAAGKGMPILHAFGAIRTWPGLALALAVLAVASCSLAPGQPPLAWVMLLLLLYAWGCIGWRLWTG